MTAAQSRNLKSWAVIDRPYSSKEVKVGSQRSTERRDDGDAHAVGIPVLASRRSTGSAGGGGVRRLTDKLAVVDGGGTNVVAFSTGDGLFLVDSGVAGNGDKLVAALKGVAANSKVNTLFNTHYHLDQTGNNELFAAAGAKIIAHDRTRQWMANDFWIPEESRYEKARPKAAWPTQTFFNKESMKAGGEQIDYGYLLDAHTGGDAYVYFKDSNVLVVGDVASPVKDPELDWITGAWIGGRVDAMDLLLKISNDKTMIRSGHRSGDDPGRVQGGTRNDGDRSAAAVQAGPLGRRPQGYVGRGRVGGAPAHLEGSL